LTGHPLLRQRTDRPVVTTGRASQVSAQHAVAASLLKGRAGLTEFSDAVVQDPAVRALGQCLHFIDDASYGIDAAKVTLQFKNHASVSRHIAHARGSVKHPLSDAEIEEKFLSLSSARLNPSQAQTLIDAIWQIETMPNVAALMQMAQVSPRHP